MQNIQNRSSSGWRKCAKLERERTSFSLFSVIAILLLHGRQGKKEAIPDEKERKSGGGKRKEKRVRKKEGKRVRVVFSLFPFLSLCTLSAQFSPQKIFPDGGKWRRRRRLLLASIQRSSSYLVSRCHRKRSFHTFHTQTDLTLYSSLISR